MYISPQKTSERFENMNDVSELTYCACCCWEPSFSSPELPTVKTSREWKAPVLFAHPGSGSLIHLTAITNRPSAFAGASAAPFPAPVRNTDWRPSKYLVV